MNNIRTDEPRSVCDLDPALPVWFGEIIERLLAKRPEDRIETAAALVELLEKQIEPPLRGKREFSARGWGALAAACAVGLVICGAVYYRGAWLNSSGLSNPDLGSATKSVSGFVVDDHSQAPYETLKEAVAAASNDSVIVVHGDGPFKCNPISVNGKALTIRAAASYRPRFTPERAVGEIGPKFLTSDADLRIEGIEVDWPIEAAPIDINSPLLGFDDAGERCVISSFGQLHVDHCRVIAGRFGTCVGAGLGNVSISNCHFVSPSGVALAWRPSVSKVTVEQCLFEGKVLFLFRSFAGTADPTVVRLDSSTVIAERAFSVLAANPVRRRIELQVSNNVLKSQFVTSLFVFGGFRPFQEPKMAEALKEVIDWHDDSNVYQQGVVYLAVNPVRQPLGTLPSNLDSLDKWQSFWSQTGSKSIEGKIKMKADPKEGIVAIESIESPSGPIPANAGADLSRIGPAGLR